MKTLTLLFCLIANTIVFSQDDSLFLSIFISPVDELVISESDSLEVVDDPLLIDESITQFNYTFYLAGVDVSATEIVEILFTNGSDVSVTSTYTMSEIDSSETIIRVGDVIYIPLGEYGYLNSYTYTATLKDINDTVILTSSEQYSNL